MTLRGCSHDELFAKLALWLLRRLERSFGELCVAQKRAAHLSVVLRSQIQESEAIRQTQAIEHIRLTTRSHRDSTILKRGALNQAKYFDNLASVVCN